ncbi:MAG TPA: acetylxylan esterase [Bryobacteraceae bacterium]|jgi:cephalosporin-C deacetylase-like acetyl esterase
MRSLLPAVGIFLAASTLPAADDLIAFHEAAQAPPAQLTRYLNAIGQKELDKRAAAIAAITTRAQAVERQRMVREKIRELVGGLPSTYGPLNARVVGELKHPDYRIEKIIYESLPRFYVTANIYLPTHGTGPFPAVLMPIGHWEGGKEGDRQIAVGLAKKGIIALEYDPLSQGERIQYYDPELRASKVGSSTAEHSHANGQTQLIGDSIARYRIIDGIRGIDYLQSRSDVDRNRIGCAGCSGGGTLTSYISALDDRVKVAMAACYVNSWQDLLAGIGPQDGEQVFPHFVEEGLDIADFVESFAPKPWLIESTRDDFFPLAGAERAYKEAKRFYTVMGAEDHVSWFVGPGGHGVPPVSREALFDWFIRFLNDGKGDPKDEPEKLDAPDQLLCTRTGQVADSLGGETVFTLNKARAKEILPPHAPVTPAVVRQMAAIDIHPGGKTPALRVHQTYQRSGYKIEVISYESEPGIEIPGLLLIPDAAGKHRAALVADPRPKSALMKAPNDLEDLVGTGYVVLLVEPRGISETGSSSRQADVLGDYRDAARAYVVGKTLVGMRAEDIIRGVDYLVSRPDVDGGAITAIGQGSLGIPLLHAAILDDRISRIVLDHTLQSYREALDHPIDRELYNVLVPGVLKKYDLPEMIAALAPRKVIVLNPVDQVGKPVAGQYRGPDEPLHEFLRQAKP